MDKPELRCFFCSEMVGISWLPFRKPMKINSSPGKRGKWLYWTLTAQDIIFAEERGFHDMINDITNLTEERCYALPKENPQTPLCFTQEIVATSELLGWPEALCRLVWTELKAEDIWMEDD